MKVRRLPDGTWVVVTVELISPNEASLAVSAAEGLGSQAGFTLDPRTGRQILLLLRCGSAGVRMYEDILSGARWEVEHDEETRGLTVG